MLSKVIFAALCAMVASRAIDLDNYTFDQYVKDFKLKFQSTEVEHRRANFLAELARVKMHNAKNLSWKEGLNKFSAMTPAEKKGYMGRSKGAAGASQKLLKGSKELPADFEMKPVSMLPKHVDWRTKSVVSPVKDQGYCGSCWAFAATEVIESHVALATGKLFDLSPQQIAMCSPNPDSCGGTGGCHGATAEIAFEYVTSSNGLFEEFQYPYSSYYGRDFECSLPELAVPVVHINGYVKLPENNYTALMNAIATVGPIAVSVDAGAWSGYESGVFSGCNQQNPDINHAVVLVGYGEENGQKYWLVRNSWSPNWGELGYIKVARLDNEDQACGIDMTPQDGTACAGDDTPKRVCGTCGMLYDSSYPLEATAL